jgi:glycerate dehydrogenase
MANAKHKVVILDDWVKPPQFNFKHEIRSYSQTNVRELADRIKDATIIIISGTKITREGIENAPRLQLIACNGTGTDHIDTQAAREHGVAVCRVPAQNTDSVSEHAFALYYSIRRRVVEMHHITMDGITWSANTQLARKLGNPPRTNAEETLVIIGYGALGERVESIGKALGMKVMIAERKGAESVRSGRTAFSDAIRAGTVFIFLTPLDASTRDMVSTSELNIMDPTALLINVGRGGVINESSLAESLRAGRIGGAATDVFEHEPATRENCPLLDPSIPNLILSPHVAWYSKRTIEGTIKTVKANIEGFVSGHPQNLVVEGRRGFDE